LLPQQHEAALVELADIPVGIGEEAVDARLVGGLGELAVDAGDVLAVSDEQAGEVFGEVAALRFVGEQIAELAQGVFDDGGEVNDAGHSRLPKKGHPPLR
jgi:hypothetical protein